MSTPASAGTGRTRRILSAILAAAAVLATVVSLVGLWTFRTLTDTELFVDRVGVIIQDPAVASAIGDIAADRLTSELDIESRLDNVLPAGAASALAGPLTAGMERWIAQGTTDLLQSQRLQQAWEASLTISHQLTMDLISGDGGANVQTADGAVVINVTPIINALVGEAAQSLGNLLGRDITPPQVTTESLDEAVSELNKALGTDLPADIGTITVVQSENLAAVQAAYSAARTAVWLAPLVALALVGLALVASRRRVRTLLWIVVATALGLLLIGLLAAPVEQALLDAVPEAGLQQAVAAAYQTVLSSLMTGIAVAAVLGILAGIGLLVTGQSRTAAAATGMAGRHRAAFLAGGAVVSLIVLALLPGRGWTELLIVAAAYGIYVVAVLLARPSQRAVA